MTSVDRGAIDGGSGRLKARRRIEPAAARLLRSGAAGLSDAELLRLVLDGPGGEVERAGRVDRLLERVGDLASLALEGPSGMAAHGVGRRDRVVLEAIFEIGRRLAREAIQRRDPMTRPGVVATYLRLRFCRGAHEVMGALYLDARNRLLAEGEVYVGTLSRAAVEPRGLLKEALRRDAAGLILFHTHPSGDPTPSAEDLAFTRRMSQAGEVIGVRLVDHLVVGNGGRWVSLRRLGRLD